MEQPLFLSVVALVAVCGVIGFSFGGKGLKYRGLGDGAVFLCLGPILTYGFARAIGRVHPFEVIYFGLLFGWLAVLYIQLRNFQNIMTDSQAKVGTFVSRIGFDKCKYLFSFHIFVIFVLVGGLYWVGDFRWFALLPFVAMAIGGFGLLKRILQVSSPLSSSIRDISQLGLNLHLMAVTLINIILFIRWMGVGS